MTENPREKYVNELFWTILTHSQFYISGAKNEKEQESCFKTLHLLVVQSSNTNLTKYMKIYKRKSAVEYPRRIVKKEKEGDSIFILLNKRPFNLRKNYSHNRVSMLPCKILHVVILCVCCSYTDYLLTPNSTSQIPSPATSIRLIDHILTGCHRYHAQCCHHISSNHCICHYFCNSACFSTFAMLCGRSVQWFLEIFASSSDWLLELHFHCSALYHIAMDLHTRMGREKGSSF